MKAASAIARPQAPAGLLSTLLAFEQSPGRFAVVLREPRLVFEHLQAVLLLAAGRDLPELAAPLAQQPQARRAARFFVRSVMLRPGADHYTLLGLTPGFEPGTLREHYRLMIRMTHPDFAGEDGEWPFDAATRINLANDVLSSSVRRAEYNASLPGAGQAQGPSGAPQAPRRAPLAAARPLPAAAVLPPRRVKRTASWSEAWTLRLKFALASLGALGTGWALLAMNPPGSDTSLVVLAAKKSASVVVPEPEPLLLAAPTAKVDVEASAAERDEAPQALEAKTQEAPVRPIWRERRAKPSTEAALPVVQVAAAATTTVAPVVPAAAQLEPPTDEAALGLDLTAANTLSHPRIETSKPTAGATRPAPESIPIPKFDEVQPVLAKIVQQARGGLGKPVAYLIHPSTRYSPAAQAFVFAFQDALAGTKVVDVVRTDMKALETPGGLVVNMQMTFQLEDANGWPAERRMNLRAHFARIEQAPVLTRLVVNP